MSRKMSYIKILYKNPQQFKNICKRYVFTKIISRFFNFHKSIYPTSITWAITGKCNYKCPFCAVKNYYIHSDTKSDISFDDAKRIIDRIKRYPVRILLYGGEPLIRRDIFEIMDYLRKSRMTFSIFTNAGLINEGNVDRIIDSGVSHISISLDGKRHSETRGVKNALEKTMNGIKL